MTVLSTVAGLGGAERQCAGNQMHITPLALVTSFCSSTFKPALSKWLTLIKAPSASFASRSAAASKLAMEQGPGMSFLFRCSFPLLWDGTESTKVAHRHSLKSVSEIAKTLGFINCHHPSPSPLSKTPHPGPQNLPLQICKAPWKKNRRKRKRTENRKKRKEMKKKQKKTEQIATRKNSKTEKRQQTKTEKRKKKRKWKRKKRKETEEKRKRGKQKKGRKRRNENRRERSKKALNKKQKRHHSSDTACKIPKGHGHAAPSGHGCLHQPVFFSGFREPD